LVPVPQGRTGCCAYDGGLRAGGRHGVAVLIVANTAIVIAAARRQVSFESLLVTFIVRIAVNVALVLVARTVLGPTDLNVGHTLFFVLLLSLLTSMHDRYQPVYVARVARERQGTST
jgi:hypothetical protein